MHTKAKKGREISCLRDTLSQYWSNIQGSLVSWLKEELGELTSLQQRLAVTLELVRVEEFLCATYGLPGRPSADRSAIARAFIAKMIYNMPTTRILIDRLKSDQKLRRICGWERVSDIPGEWTFSRAFAEFAESALPQRVHEAKIQKSYENELVGHISRDSTAIEAREKPTTKKAKEATEKKPRKRGRPKKGEACIKGPTRLEKQIAGMELSGMLEDLPKPCNVGTKRKVISYKAQ